VARRAFPDVTEAEEGLYDNRPLRTCNKVHAGDRHVIHAGCPFESSCDFSHHPANVCWERFCQNQLPEDPCWRTPRFQKWALAWARPEIPYQISALQLVIKMGAKDPSIRNVCKQMRQAHTTAHPPRAAPAADSFPALGGRPAGGGRGDGTGAFVQNREQQEHVQREAQQQEQAALGYQRQQQAALEHQRQQQAALEHQRQQQQAAAQRQRQEGQRQEGQRMVSWHRALARYRRIPRSQSESVACWCYYARWR
jgi:hypothetical protein